MFTKSQKMSQLAKGITKFISLYAKYGFVVNFINNKNMFEAIRENMPKVEINITMAEEKVSEVEL